MQMNKAKDDSCASTIRIFEALNSSKAKIKNFTLHLSFFFNRVNFVTLCNFGEYFLFLSRKN